MYGSENVAIVEDVIKLGGQEEEDLVSSDIYFGFGTDENIEGKGKVYGT